MSAVPTMAAMSKDMQERTGEEEQEREVAVEVSPMLRDEEKADDGEEAEEGDIEAAHSERKRK